MNESRQSWCQMSPVYVGCSVQESFVQDSSSITTLKLCKPYLIKEQHIDYWWYNRKGLIPHDIFIKSTLKSREISLDPTLSSCFHHDAFQITAWFGTFATRWRLFKVEKVLRKWSRKVASRSPFLLLPLSNKEAATQMSSKNRATTWTRVKKVHS